MQLKSNDYASESGHWYEKDGSPKYSIVGKNGNERNTTLRDARKFDLVPSVTTIIKCAAAPGLEQWKMNQVLMAALTMPRIDGEPEADYIARIMRDSKEQGRKAAERGTIIHGALEQAMLDEDVSEEFHPYIDGVVSSLYTYFGGQEWYAEKSFAHEMGFGGKVDLHSKELVIDYKTKEFTEDNLPSAYDEHIVQLAAYRNGLGLPMARCANVFVSVTVPGLVHIVEHSSEDLFRGWSMFSHLLKYWQHKNKYVP